MERRIANEIGSRNDGTRIYRYQFINDDKTNWLSKAHSYFTKKERKVAKLNHKLNGGTSTI